MLVTAEDIEICFSQCFPPSEVTLAGGGDEPLYLPAGEGAAARIIYRADYPSSALHEVAHWCIAGAERRRLVDFGYWYAPDGRAAAEQAAFFRAEIKPQALESIFSEALGIAFEVSTDNLAGETGNQDQAMFSANVAAQRQQYLEAGLPPRAARFLHAIQNRHQTKIGGTSCAPNL